MAMPLTVVEAERKESTAILQRITEGLGVALLV